MKCVNCGAVYDDELIKCPYCGTENKKAAYKNYRQKISGIIVSLFGLKEEAYSSLGKMVVISVFKGLLISGICVCLAMLVGSLMKDSIYEEDDYDKRLYEEIEWLNENIDSLNEAYEKQDLDKIDAITSSSSHGFSKWEHYDSYQLLSDYRYLLIRADTAKTLGEVNYIFIYDVLEFICPPEYYRTNKLDEEERKLYESNIDQICELMEKEFSYTREDLEKIYEFSKDEYGADLGKVKEYMEDKK